MKKNVQLAQEGLKEYLKYVYLNGCINADDLINVAEPYFVKSNYRELSDDNGNILIISDDGVGDFILQSAAIREIRRLYPQARIDLIVYSRAVDLARNCPYINNLYVNNVSGGWLPVAEQYKWNLNFAKEFLLQVNYDVAFLLGSYSNSALLAYMSGAKRRIGMSFLQSMAWDVISRDDWPKLVEYNFNYVTYGRHGVDRIMSVLDNFIGVKVADRHIECWCSAEDEKYISNKLSELNYDKIIAVGIGGTGLRKHWPVEKYAILINNINKMDNNYLFVIIGGPSEEAEGNKILQMTAEVNIINCAGKLSFCQSVALFRKSYMYIGNDTSTLHMAAAENLPVLTVNCYPADKFNNGNTMIVPIGAAPYNVPSVTVLPKKGLDECGDIKNNNSYGCIRDTCHCINQVEADIVLHGYSALKKLINDNDSKSIYIC